MSLKNRALLAIICLSIIGCTTQLKQKVGIVTTGPNEYAITRNKPLEVPPHFDLDILEQQRVVNHEKIGRDKIMPNQNSYTNKEQNLNSAEKELLETVQQQ